MGTTGAGTQQELDYEEVTPEDLVGNDLGASAFGEDSGDGSGSNAGAETTPTVDVDNDNEHTSSTTSTSDAIADTTVEEEIPTAPTDDWFEEPEDVPIPEYDPNAIEPVEIDAAPDYVRSDEEIAWAEQHAAAIKDIIDQQGIGIDEATQQLMRQQTWDIIASQRDEQLRTLEANMEQRGITNSGLLLSEEMKIHANATKSLAASITEVQIQSAFMKMASYENALGLSAQFLGYLSQNSQIQNQNKMAEWSKKQDAKMLAMQASVEVYKVKLQQAYTVNNMNAQANIQAQFETQQHIWDVELAQMEIDFATEQAKLDRNANMFGTVLGGISGLF